MPYEPILDTCERRVVDRAWAELCSSGGSESERAERLQAALGPLLRPTAVRSRVAVIGFARGKDGHEEDDEKALSRAVAEIKSAEFFRDISVCCVQ